ncbi:Transmembrane 4 L6 family member 5 [Camelus dromedarius]|uniref:Transmembrane 4 L6 family member 5 n=1 Tax=Camelus dromedarius TaxID=9838 RepID=A0A5N4D519_CAMDR|nr:Transmembrane 4 L6 family member 5 [Camelus dromedarius]
MCTGKCARFVGLSLVSLSLICITANALLLVPTRTTWTKDHISLQVWLMAGFIGGGLMILCPGIAAVRHGGKAVVVQLLWKSLQVRSRHEWRGGYYYSSSYSAPRMPLDLLLRVRVAWWHLLPLGIRNCAPNWTQMLMNDTWDYHFKRPVRLGLGSYLYNRTQWSLCVSRLYCLLERDSLLAAGAASCLEILLCGLQLVNATIGVFCGDCRTKECSRIPFQSVASPERLVGAPPGRRQEEE